MIIRPSPTPIEKNPRPSASSTAGVGSSSEGGPHRQRAASPAGPLGAPRPSGAGSAVDPRWIPLGAPVWLAAPHPGTGKPLQRLMNAQDTGGAIKGGVRADYFWGFGPEAGAQAGRMRPQGRLWVLLPRPAQ